MGPVGSNFFSPRDLYCALREGIDLQKGWGELSAVLSLLFEQRVFEGWGMLPLR